MFKKVHISFVIREKLHMQWTYNILDYYYPLKACHSLHSGTTWACWRSGCAAVVCRQGALWPHWSPSSRQLSCCRLRKRQTQTLMLSSKPALPCPASRWRSSLFLYVRNKENKKKRPLCTHIVFNRLLLSVVFDRLWKSWPSTPPTATWMRESLWISSVPCRWCQPPPRPHVSMCLSTLRAMCLVWLTPVFSSVLGSSEGPLRRPASTAPNGCAQSVSCHFSPRASARPPRRAVSHPRLPQDLLSTQSVKSKGCLGLSRANIFIFEHFFTSRFLNSVFWKLNSRKVLRMQLFFSFFVALRWFIWLFF